MIINGVKLAEEKEKKLKPKKGLKLKILVYSDDKAGLVYSQLKKEAGAWIRQ